MANDIVNLGFSVDTRQVKKGYQEFDKMEKSADKAEKSIDKAAKTTSKGFAMAKRNIAAAAAALTAYVTAGKLIEVAREFDVLNASLVTATKGTENAAKAFTAIEKFASTTPYNLAQSVDGFVKLVNLGLTPSEKALQSYGNTAAALGKDLSQMVEAVADATTGEFERLKEFGIKAKSQGDKVSLTFQGVTKTIGKNAAEIEGYLIAIGENEFAGAMAERAKTLDGAISNLGDSWDGLYRSIAGSGVSSIISDSIRSITEVIDTVSAYIASGALQAYANAFYEQWKWAFDGIAAIAGFVGDIFTAVADKILDAYEFAFGKLPAYAKNAVQRIIIEISAIVDYARIYGEAFVTMISLKFSEAADRAKVYGKDIANALNPFSDDYNADAELADLDAKYARFYSNVMGYAAERAASLKSEKEASIEIINAERDATLESFDDQLEKANELYEAFKRNRDVSGSGDALAGFKLPTKADLSGTNEEFNKWVASIRTTTTETERLNKEIKKAQDAIASGKLRSDVGAEYIADLRAQLAELDTNPFISMTEGANDALQAMSGMFESGSKDAKKLAIAMQALNLVQAVGAVLNQGTGDPYTAFGRMAAMAAMVASLGLSVGGLSGGFNDVAAQRQESQNLNTWGEKANSITKATESTADATKKLVGINTDMLAALENLAMAVTGASEIIAKRTTIPMVNTSGLYESNFLDNFGWKSFGDIFGDNFISKALDFLSGDWLFKSIGSWLGGSSSVTDEGIRIIGGSLSDLLENVTVQAFQNVDYKKWKFGSTKSATAIENLSGEVSNQFSLVFESLADSVATGAAMLGLSGDEIEKAINSFIIDTTSISLKDLDSDEQVAEIEAYFSSVFNNLSSTVIPFLEDFQKVGEELGETLSRLSTESSIATYLVDNLGLVFGKNSQLAEGIEFLGSTIKVFYVGANPFVTAANNISELVGGVDEFASKVAAFTDSFASDTKKLEIYTNAMTSALSAVGLELPDTAEGFYDLFTSLNATTAAGQAQIAAILNITDTADAYYNLLEDLNEETENASDATESITRNYREAAEALYDISFAAESVALDAALASARLGDFSLAEALDFSSLTPSKSDFANLVDYNLARAETAQKLTELQNLQDGTLSIDEKQLTVLEEIRDALSRGDTITTESSSDVSLLSEQIASMKNEITEMSRKFQYGVMKVRVENQ